MATSDKNRSFFTDYEKFRKFLKINFYYNSLSSEGIKDYIDEINSNSTYSQYRNNAESTSNGKMSFPKYNRKKSIKYDVNQFESDYNVLADSFRLKTLTSFEAIISIYILLFLSQGGKTKNEIDNLFNTKSGDTKSISNKLSNMLTYGLIYKEGHKYFLNNSYFSDLDNSELLKLTNYVDFMKAIIRKFLDMVCLIF